MKKLENLIWTEASRPSKIDDVILPESTKNQIKDMIKSNNLTHMLFSGSAGTGKTTLAKAIANEIDADVMFINASNENGIDVLRTKITQFASTVSFTGSKKMIILDEADHLTGNVQAALRGALEEFASVLFVLTCNYKNRIIDPLISRLNVVDFTFSKTEKQTAAMAMLKRCCSILESNNVEYDKKVVAALITKRFPDFRKTISELQKYAASGCIDAGILSTFDESGINDLTKLLKEKNFTGCRQWVANASLDPSSFFRAFYDKISIELEQKAVPQLILHIANYQEKATRGVDQEINFMAFIIEVLRDCQFK